MAEFGISFCDLIARLLSQPRAPDLSSMNLLRICLRGLLFPLIALALFSTGSHAGIQGAPAASPPPIPQADLVAAFKESVDEASGLTAAQKTKLKADVDSGAIKLSTHVDGDKVKVKGLNTPVKPGTGMTYADGTTGKPTVTVNEDWVDAKSGSKNNPNFKKKQKKWIKRIYKHEIWHLPGTGVGGSPAVGENTCSHVGLILEDMKSYCALAAGASSQRGKDWFCAFASQSLAYAAKVKVNAGGCPQGKSGASGPPNFGWTTADMAICAFCDPTP